MNVDPSASMLPQRSKWVSVIVPVFKNYESLEELCSAILEVRKDQFPQHSLEILFIDDGSPDKSWEVLERLRETYPNEVSLLKLSRNFGQLSAILAGYDAAQGDAVIMISADLQDPVELMGRMVVEWENGHDLVIAYRESRDDERKARFFSRIAYAFARSANPRIPRGGFDYLLMSRRAVDIMKTFKGQHRFFQGDVLWLGFPTAFLPYVRKRRRHGKSAYTFAKKFKSFLDLTLDSSFLPIRMMSAIGFLTASGGMLYAVTIVLNRLIRGQLPFPGWAPLMIVILLTGGLIMVMLGIIGEYLWRIYDDIKGKPMYAVDKRALVPKPAERASEDSAASAQSVK